MAARTIARARGRRSSWTAAMHSIKYDKSVSIETDVRREIIEFFGVSEVELKRLETAHQGFDSKAFHRYVESFFTDHTNGDAALFDAYSRAALPYTLMLGVGCPRYATVYPFIEPVLARCRTRSRPIAVDYGSGVGDASLLLAAHGFDVYMVDLPDRKADFALWRMRRRGFSPHFIAADAKNPYPSLPDHATLVVTVEVWEHLRHPVRALENINAVTTPGRSFLINTNVDFGHEIAGDHLGDGMAEGRSSAYTDLYAATWRPLDVQAPDGRLFERIQA
jgi:SAM-dependent methyltransferase